MPLQVHLPSLHEPPNEIPEVQLGGLEVHRTGFELGEVEQISHQAVHPAAFIEDVSHVCLPLGLRDGHFRVEQGLGETTDGGERSREVVGDVSEELLPLPLRVLELPSRLLEPGRHLVECTAESSDLVAAEVSDASIEFSRRHARSMGIELAEPSRDSPEEPETGESGEQRREWDEDEAGTRDLPRKVEPSFEVHHVHELAGSALHFCGRRTEPLSSTRW